MTTESETYHAIVITRFRHTENHRLMEHELFQGLKWASMDTQMRNWGCDVVMDPLSINAPTAPSSATSSSQNWRSEFYMAWASQIPAIKWNRSLIGFGSSTRHNLRLSIQCQSAYSSIHPFDPHLCHCRAFTSEGCGAVRRYMLHCQTCLRSAFISLSLANNQMDFYFNFESWLYQKKQKQRYPLQLYQQIRRRQTKTMNFINSTKASSTHQRRPKMSCARSI